MIGVTKNNMIVPRVIGFEKDLAEWEERLIG